MLKMKVGVHKSEKSWKIECNKIAVTVELEKSFQLKYEFFSLPLISVRSCLICLERSILDFDSVETPD